VPPRHDCRFGKPTPRHAANPLFRVSGILPELLTFRGIIHSVRHKPRCGGSSENPRSPCLSMFTALSVLEDLRRFPACLIYRAVVLRALTGGLYIGRPFCSVKRNHFAINRRKTGGNTGDRRKDGNAMHALGAIRDPVGFVLQLDRRTKFEACVGTACIDWRFAVRLSGSPTLALGTNVPCARNSRSTNRIGTARMPRKRSCGAQRRAMRLCDWRFS